MQIKADASQRRRAQCAGRHATRIEGYDIGE